MELHQNGIRGLDCIRAFLGSRYQQVVIDGEESEPIPDIPGVPQGSVLRPILFLVYINEGLDGGSWYSLITKNLAIYSVIKILAYSLKLARLFIKI